MNFATLRCKMLLHDWIGSNSDPDRRGEELDEISEFY